MKKRLLVITLMGCLAAFTADTFMAQPTLAAEEGGHGEKSEKGDKEKGKKGENKEDEEVSGGRFEGDPIYVHMKPLILPVINDEGIEQIVSLLLDINVKDTEAADTLRKNMPRLTDALLRHLYGALDTGSLSKGKLVNISKVKEKAISAVSEIVPREHIADVLVQAVSQRML